MKHQDQDLKNEHKDLYLKDSPKDKKLISDLLDSQRSCVLATCLDSQSYTSLMAYVHASDLKSIILATRRKTSKYRNISANPRVALLIDNRQNKISDSDQALALTVLGTASEVRAQELEILRDLFLKKHPQLTDFLADPDCALIEIQVERYVLVSSFEEVKVFQIPYDPNLQS